MSMWNHVDTFIEPNTEDMWYFGDWYDMAFGIWLGMSPDGNTLAVQTDAEGVRGKLVIFEKNEENVFEQADGSPVQPPFTEMWKDDFSGTSTQETLTEETPTGTINETGGNLVISVPGTVDSSLENAPKAWRYEESIPSGSIFECTISAFTTSTPDLHAGLMVVDHPSGGPYDSHEYYQMIDLSYSGSAYQVQWCTRMYGASQTYWGTPYTVSDPNVTPLQLRLVTAAWEGFGLYVEVKQGAGDWVRIHQVYDDEWGDAFTTFSKMGLYLHNSGAFPAGSVSFTEFAEYDMRWAMNQTGGDYTIAISNNGIIVNTLFYATGNDRELLGEVQADTPTAGDDFGYALACCSHCGAYQDQIEATSDNSTLHLMFMLVGAPGRSSDQGAVDVFEYLPTGWSKIQTLTAGDGASGDRFGSTVEIVPHSHNVGADPAVVVFIGAPNATVSGQTNAGATYVFEYNPASNTWSQRQKLTAATPEQDGLYGHAIGAYYSSNVFYLNIGEPGGNSNKGALHRYSLSLPYTGDFSFIDEKVDTSGASGDKFGWSVSRFYVGAPGCDSSKGAVFNGSSTPPTKYTATDGQAGDEYGYSVLYMDGNLTVAVGAPGCNSDTGATYIHKTSGWTLWTKIEPTNTSAGDRFGCALGRRWLYLLVGADKGGSGPGFVGHYIGYAPATEIERIYSQSSASGDLFGSAIARSNFKKAFCLGTPGVTSGTGAAEAHRCYDVRRGDTSYGDSSAFVYQKIGGTWTYVQTLLMPLSLREPDGFEYLALAADGSRLVTYTGSDDAPTTPMMTYDWSGSAFVFKDALDIGWYYDSTWLAERLAYPALIGDGSRLILSGPTFRRKLFLDSFDSNVVEQSTSVPNPDCGFVEGSAGYLTGTVDSTNNPADWDGGGSRTCPILYIDLDEVAVTPAAWTFCTAQVGYTSIENAAYFVGVHLTGDDPAADAFVVEFNSADYKIYIWRVVDSGSKVAIYTSSALSSASSAYVLFNLYYNPSDDTVNVTAVRGTTASCGTFDVGFTPTRFGLQGRMASPATLSGTFRAYRISMNSYHDSMIRVYERSGDTWSPIQSIYPVDTPGGETTDFYGPHVTPSGDWLAVSATGGDLLLQWSDTEYEIVAREASDTYGIAHIFEPFGDTPYMLTWINSYDGLALLKPDLEGGPWTLEEVIKSGLPWWTVFAASADTTWLAINDPYWEDPNIDPSLTDTDGRVLLYLGNAPPVVTPTGPYAMQVAVSVDSNINLRITDDRDELTDGWTVEVKRGPNVDWETAFIHNASPDFQTGWQGAASLLTVIGGGYDLTLDPEESFTPHTVIVVRVTATDDIGNKVIVGAQ